MINRVELSARIVERAALRYTPAGLPALDLRLAHAGQVLHAGQPRQVSLEIHATAIGEELVETLRALPVGAEVNCTGFLGKQRNGKGVMLHLSTVVSTPPSPASY